MNVLAYRSGLNWATSHLSFRIDKTNDEVILYSKNSLKMT